jgi:hypothetical protein
MEVKRYFADEIDDTWSDVKVVSATDYDSLLALAKRLRKQGTWAYHHAETCRCETCQLDHDSAWLA